MDLDLDAQQSPAPKAPFSKRIIHLQVFSACALITSGKFSLLSLPLANLNTMQLCKVALVSLTLMLVAWAQPAATKMIAAARRHLGDRYSAAYFSGGTPPKGQSACVDIVVSACRARGFDLRSLVPLDIDTIEASVKKTGRCLIVHEATRTSGFGAELSALVQERCFYALEAPVQRVTGFDTPYPHSLEWAYFPGPVRIAAALNKILKD